MAQAFLETDFLLRRATPTPARTQAPAASRPAFTIRDPELNRAQARSQDTRMQTGRAQDSTRQSAAVQDSRTQEARTREARTQDTRTAFARPERDRPDVPDRSKRTSAPGGPGRDGAASRGTAPTGADPSGKAPPSKGPSAKGGAEVEGAAGGRVSAAPAGATGSPEAAMVTTVIAAGATVEASATEQTLTEETETDDEAGEASIAEPDASLLALGFLPPPPPPKSAVLHGTPSSTGEGETPAGSVPSSSGPTQSSAGALKPSQGEFPVVAKPEASTGAALGGKADPAVAAHETKPTSAEIALPDGLPRVRESFDSMLAGAAVTPAATASQTPSAAATQTPPAAPPVPLGAVPMTIGLRSLQGSNHFEIRLDPGDLGRIDVSLDIDKERGTVMAHLVVDRVETLALLQRDTGSLQQALSQAGLDASEASINLSLRSDTPSGGQGSEGQGPDGRRPEGRPGGPGLPGRPEGHAALVPVPMRNVRGLTGLDIRI